MTTIEKSRRRPSKGGDDDEDSDDEPTSPSSPLAQFPPPPPAESRSRAPEFYGFVAWAVTCLLFVLYFLWAILPDQWITWLGVTWYPNRCVPNPIHFINPREGQTFSSPSFGGLTGWLALCTCHRKGPPPSVVLISDSGSDSNFSDVIREWALLVPAWTVVTVLLTYFTYFSMALRGTPAFSDSSTYTGGLELCPMTANSGPFFDRSFHVYRFKRAISRC
jgi:hypothetical protein